MSGQDGAAAGEGAVKLVVIARGCTHHRGQAIRVQPKPSRFEVMQLQER